MTLLDQVASLAAGTTTSTALVEQALAGASERDGQLRAFVRLRRDEARAEAAASDQQRADGDPRPLLGVPIAVKDSHAVAGSIAPANGLPGRPETLATADDPWVAALRAAGCVVIGQTTMPPLALTPWGSARNPADVARTSGGSSSGSAAAVAAGVVAVATASDGGGSIRIPAALCGLFGFKPAVGLVPGFDHWHGLSTSGVLTATAADTAAVYDAAALPCSAGSWRAATETAPDRVRIAWTDKPSTPLGRPTADVLTALTSAVTALRSLGHWVDAARLPLTDAAAVLSLRLTRGAADDLAAERRRAPVGLDEPYALMTAIGGRVPDPAVAWARRRGEVIRDRLRALPFDVLLTPTTPEPAIVADAARLGSRRSMLLAARGAAWTGAWNACGLPAAHVPTGRTAAGLPVGVQLVDLRGDGAVLFGLAAALADIV